MLITLRYQKTGIGAIVAHTDILRALNRTFRRAGMDINYSAGFHKHMILKLTQPLPLGIAGLGEWASVDTEAEISGEEFLEKFNRNCPPYLHADKVFVTEKKPELAAKCNASSYFFATEEAYAKKDEIEKIRDGYVFSYAHGGKDKTVDAASLLYALSVDEDGIRTVMASGAINLRADFFAQALNRDFGLHIALADIYRTEQYIRSEKEMLSATDYMEKL